MTSFIQKLMTISRVISYKKVWISIGILSLLLLAVPTLRITSVIVPLICFYLLLPAKHFGSLSRAIISAVCVACSLACMSVLLWLCSVPITSLSATVTLLLIGALPLLIGYVHKKPLESRFEWKRIDIASGIVAAVAVFSVASPFVSHFQPSAALAYISSGGDNISHIELVKGMHTKQTLLYSDDAQSITSVIHKGLVGYPLGWHTTPVYIGTTLAFDVFTPGKILYLYIFFSILTVFTLIYTLSYMLFTIAQSYSKRRLRLLEYIAGGIAVLCFWVFVLFDLYQRGFITQLSSFGILLLLIIIANQIISTEKNESRIRYFLLGGLLLSGISMTWTFIVPVAALVFTAAIIIAIRRAGHYHSTIRSLIGPALLVAPFILFQFYVQLNYSLSSQRINESGDITTQDPYMIGILLLVLTTLLFEPLKRHPVIVRLLIFTLLVSFIFSLCIFIYQLSTIGKVDYFFYKSSYTVLLSMFTLFVGAVLLPNLHANIRIAKKILFSFTAILIFCIISLPQTAPLRNYHNGETLGIGVRIADKIIRHDEDTQTDTPIFIGACTRTQDFIATRIVSILTEKNDQNRQNMYNAFLTDTPAGVKKRLSSYESKNDSSIKVVPIYTSDVRLKTLLARDATESKFIELDPINSAHCSDSIIESKKK
ncbi:hypothetical protein EON76_01450 [bacterium]|nr:MAG: hypothetical protein EON76_01450 [bacterium]